MRRIWSAHFPTDVIRYEFTPYTELTDRSLREMRSSSSSAAAMDSAQQQQLTWLDMMQRSAELVARSLAMRIANAVYQNNLPEITRLRDFRRMLKARLAILDASDLTDSIESDAREIIMMSRSGLSKYTKRTEYVVAALTVATNCQGVNEDTKRYARRLVDYFNASGIGLLFGTRGYADGMKVFYTFVSDSVRTFQHITDSTIDETMRIRAAITVSAGGVVLKPVTRMISEALATMIKGGDAAVDEVAIRAIGATLNKMTSAIQTNDDMLRKHDSDFWNALKAAILDDCDRVCDGAVSRVVMLRRASAAQVAPLLVADAPVQAVERSPFRFSSSASAILEPDSDDDDEEKQSDGFVDAM
jgi:hypothetical protein